MKKLLYALCLLLTLAACHLPKDAKPLVARWSSAMPASHEEQADGRRGATADTMALPAALPDRPEQILRRAGYTVSYNRATLLPNWVAWHLTAAHTEGPYKRQGIAFSADDEVPEPRADTYDYQRSGYDRGHMCPSADNRWSQEAQRDCFLLTNICPQLHALNDGDWRILEEQCRSWARRWGDLYIVCGPVLTRQRHRRIGQHRVTVPEAFFKVIVCLNGTPRGIGFIYRNERGRHPQAEYVNSIDEVERITGIDFFASLPDDVEDQVERTARLADWQQSRQ